MLIKYKMNFKKTRNTVAELLKAKRSSKEVIKFLEIQLKWWKGNKLRVDG